MNSPISERIRHCEICQNRKFNSTGIVCGLTGEKPEFSKSCEDFRPKDDFAKHLIDINVDYEQLRKLRFDVFTFGILFISIGTLIVIGTIVATALIFDRGVFVLGGGQIAMISIGLLIIAAGIAPILSYRRRREVVYSRKVELDQILDKYQVTYEFILKFVRTYMDKWKVKYTLTLRQMWSTAENYEKETFIKKKLI